MAEDTLPTYSTYCSTMEGEQKYGASAGSFETRWEENSLLRPRAKQGEILRAASYALASTKRAEPTGHIMIIPTTQEWIKSPSAVHHKLEHENVHLLGRIAPHKYKYRSRNKKSMREKEITWKNEVRIYMIANKVLLWEFSGLR